MAEETIRIGYRRLQNGNVEPVCEPPVDVFLLELWKYAGMAIVRGDHYVATVSLDRPVLIEGRLTPNELVRKIAHMAHEAAERMAAVMHTSISQYPFDLIAEHVVAHADSRLLMSLDHSMVETELGRLTGDGRKMQLETPKIMYDGSRVRVVVTGHPASHPLRRWADRVICRRVHDAILVEIATHAGGDA